MNWSLRIKYFLAEVLYRIGILRALLAKRLRGKVVVLMYHRVLPEKDWQASMSSDGIIVTPANFSNHLAWLNRHMELLDFGRFKEWLNGEVSLKRPGCLITFDDGWHDNYDHALPLLQQHNTPALLFLATDYINTDQTFWQEELGQGLQRLCDNADSQSRVVFEELGLNGVADQALDTRRRNIISAVRKLKSQSWREIETILQQVRTLCARFPQNKASDVDRFMSWRQAQTLQAGGIALASHGCSHRIMPTLDNAALAREMTASREVLQKYLNSSKTPAYTIVDALAYPNGDHDERVVSEARRHGYSLAFTTQPGCINRGDDPLRLRRINVPEHTTSTPAMLACRLLGIF